MTPGADPVLLLLAAPDRGALVAALRRHRAMTSDDLAALPMRGPAPGGAERIAIVASPTEMHDRLDLALARLPSLTTPRLVVRAQGLYFASQATPGRVAFLFPGQGSEHVGMLRTLCQRMPAVRAWFDTLDRAAEAMFQPPLTPLIAGPSADRGTDDDRARSPRRGLFDMERGAQLGTTADLALHEVAEALGLRADVHVGHSNGEHAAVIAAGMVKDADREALCRGFIRMGLAGARLAAPIVPERLIAVGMLRPERLAALPRGGEDARYLAMDNCPNQAVIGGTQPAMDALSREILAGGGVAMPLPFSRAYHTPLFADWAATFATHYDELSLGAGRVPVFSCCSVRPLPEEPALCRRAMAAQWTAPVRFSATIQALYESSGIRTFVEIGPESRLTAFVEDILRGRPHLAVSMSSAQRGEVEQLCHLLGELFVIGLPIQPVRLLHLFDGGARPVHDVRAFGAQVHARLIAEAQATLGRTDAAVRVLTRAAAADRPESASDAWPLVGRVVRATPTRLTAARLFAPRTDPFVEDHALGRRDSGWPGSPLPVLPFTLCLEMASEAACRLTGLPPREILDVRASRWLALDAGALTVEMEAEHDRGHVRVRLADANAGLSGAAFEATISAHSTSREGVTIGRDPDATAPSRWNAPSFYDRYAFHGPGFRGISQVTSIGPRGIEAELCTTANPGLPLSSLHLDPAMLDCAGQLVAFWLLEQQRRDPSFGIFPFAMRRAIIERAPVVAGTLVRCRGEIRFDRLTTQASFVFETADGITIAAVEGLAQRLIDFPPWLAQCIFGRVGRRRAPLEHPLPLSPSSADRELLTGSWGIWERALAHLCLAPDDFSAWRKKAKLSEDDRLSWLLSHVTHQPRDAGTITNRGPW